MSTPDPICDVCERTIERTRWASDKRPADGEESIRASMGLRRRLARWLLGPVYRFRQWGADRNNTATMVRIDVCQDCRERIKHEVQ